MTTDTAPLVVHLAVYDTLADWEAGHAVAHINDPEHQQHPGRYRVRTVGPTTNPVTTAGGLRIVPDLALAEVDPTDSAMLILPGATAWMTGGLTEFTDAAARFLAADVPVAGICGATVGLAQAGLLDGRRHTSNAAEALSWTGYAGAAGYVDEPAVTDVSRPGHLITAAAMQPVAFAREIFAELDLYSPATLAAWFTLYSGTSGGFAAGTSGGFAAGDPAGYHELMALS